MDPATIAALGQKAAQAQQAVAGVGQIVVGGIQKAKARKINQSNPRAVYDAPDEIDQNNDIAASRASRGLSDATMQAYISNNNASYTGALDTILKNGGSSNNIGDLYGHVTDGFRNLAMLDEQMRANNIRMFMESNNQVADARDKEWQINTYAPYADKAQAAAALSKQGSDNIWKGINAVGGAAANAATSNQYANEGRQVFAPDPNVLHSFSNPPSSVNPSSTLPPAVQEVRNRWPGLLNGKPQ